MRSMLRKMIGGWALAVIGGVAVATAAGAEPAAKTGVEPAATSAPPAATTEKGAVAGVTRCQGLAREEAPRKHVVYVAEAMCLRTMSVFGEYENASQALDASLAARRKFPHVWVATGTTPRGGWFFSPVLESEKVVARCTVYTRSCSRTGWLRSATSPEGETAEQYAASIRPVVRIAQVVYDFETKASE